jgi:hypothetical protein
VLVAVRRVSTTAPNANGSATRRPDVSETEALRAALMDEFDEVEWQVEAHVRSCPDREGETTQSCDLRTAWDALLAALASPEPTPEPEHDINCGIDALRLGEDIGCTCYVRSESTPAEALDPLRSALERLLAVAMTEEEDAETLARLWREEEITDLDIDCPRVEYEATANAVLQRLFGAER